LSGNHNGDLNRALHLVDEAAKTGCDAIKIQTYTADTLTIQSDRSEFKIEGGLWDGRTLYDLYQDAHTPFEWHEALFERAAKNNVTMFSTPFDETAINLLEGLEAPAYKIASFEIVDLSLIAAVARTKKPMIISTGLANLAEIEVAVTCARDNGCRDLVLLHCISSYPAPSDQSNLRTMVNLGETFGSITGLSDHTLGTATSVAAVALGGTVIEKHFTLARADGGPDADFSLEPSEFRALCSDCTDAWRSLGKVHYEVKPAEAGNKQFRRSLYAVSDIKKGDVLNHENVRSIRPGHGMPPSRLGGVLGKIAMIDIARGTPMSDDLFWS
jgi:pseudaminic acid synthase